MIFLIVGALAFTGVCNFLESGFEAVEEQKNTAFGEALEKAAPGAWMVLDKGKVHALVEDPVNAALALDGLRCGCPLRPQDRGAVPAGVPEDVAIRHYRKVGRLLG